MGTDGRTTAYNRSANIARSGNPRLPRIVLGDRSMHVLVPKINGPSLWVHAKSTTVLRVNWILDKPTDASMSRPP